MRLAVAVLLIVGCGPTAQHPADVAGVRITGSAFAKSYARPRMVLRVRAAYDPAGLNGTELALRFLDAAQARGATYVSEIAVVIQLVHDGVPVECRSTLIVEDGQDDRRAPAPPAPPPAPEESSDEPIYTTSISPWRPESVVADVDDRDLICKKEAKQVLVTRPKYATRFDAEVPRYIAPGEMPMVDDAVVVWFDRCHLSPARRRVQRYAHYIAAKFQPIDWRRVGRDFSDWKLREAAPECHRFAPAPGAPMRRWIEGRLYDVGSLARTKWADISTR